jgi:hypothetical protein
MVRIDYGGGPSPKSVSGKGARAKESDPRMYAKRVASWECLKGSECMLVLHCTDDLKAALRKSMVRPCAVRVVLRTWL